MEAMVSPSSERLYRQDSLVARSASDCSGVSFLLCQGDMRSRSLQIIRWAATTADLSVPAAHLSADCATAACIELPTATVTTTSTLSIAGVVVVCSPL